FCVFRFVGSPPVPGGARKFPNTPPVCLSIIHSGQGGRELPANSPRPSACGNAIRVGLSFICWSRRGLTLQSSPPVAHPLAGRCRTRRLRSHNCQPRSLIQTIVVS